MEPSVSGQLKIERSKPNLFSPKRATSCLGGSTLCCSRALGSAKKCSHSSSIEEKNSRGRDPRGGWSLPSQTTVERRFIGGRRTKRRMQTQTSLARPMCRPEASITPLAWRIFSRRSFRRRSKLNPGRCRRLRGDFFVQTMAIVKAAPRASTIPRSLKLSMIWPRIARTGGSPPSPFPASG